GPHRSAAWAGPTAAAASIPATIATRIEELTLGIGDSFGCSFAVLLTQKLNAMVAKQTHRQLKVVQLRAVAPASGAGSQQTTRSGLISPCEAGGMSVGGCALAVTG